jgi:Kdo2-lipid IVA lauroyltransferase/acyltransferase
MGYFLQYCLIQSLTQITTRLPIQLSTWLARRAGDLTFFLWAGRRRVALANLNTAFPRSKSSSEKQIIARKSFQHAAISFMELFMVSKFTKDPPSHFKVSGFQHARKAFADGRGVVLAVSHLGSWELLAFLPPLINRKTSVAVKSIKNRYLDKRIDKLRRMAGSHPIPKKNSLKTIMSELKNKNIVALLIDQWAGSDGIWVDFFGRATSTTSMPARLAKRTGCVLIPAYCLRLSAGQYSIELEEPLELESNEEAWERNMTLRLNGLLEKKISRYPEQWTWGHRRWKAKGDRVRRA